MIVMQVVIEGLEPGLLQHRCPDMLEGTTKAIKYKDLSEEAEATTYRLPNGNLYQPAEHLERAMISAAGMFKIGRRSAAGVAAAAFYVTPRQIDHGTNTYEIDKRTVVIKSTGGRIMRARALLYPWSLTFEIGIDETLIQPNMAREIMETAGQQKGIGDFRPEKKGRFGKFVVKDWSRV